MRRAHQEGRHPRRRAGASSWSSGVFGGGAILSGSRLILSGCTQAGRSLVAGVAVPIRRVEGARPGGPAVDDELLSWVTGGRADSADRPLRIPSVGIEVGRAGGLRDLHSRQRVATVAALSVPLAEFERRDQYRRRVTVGAGPSAVSHQSVHGFLRAQLRSAARGVAACGVVHDRPPPALGCGTYYPAGVRLWWRAGQTPGRHAGQIAMGVSCRSVTQTVYSAASTPVRPRDPGGDAYEVTPRMGASDLLAGVEPDPHGLPVGQRERYGGRNGSGRSPVTARAGHLSGPWFQLSGRGAQRCTLPGPGLLPVGMPPHLDRQLQQAAAEGCRPLPVGRIGKAPIGPLPCTLRGDQVLGDSSATHTSYCIMCSISGASLQVS